MPWYPCETVTTSFADLSEAMKRAFAKCRSDKRMAHELKLLQELVQELEGSGEWSPDMHSPRTHLPSGGLALTRHMLSSLIRDETTSTRRQMWLC